MFSSNTITGLAFVLASTLCIGLVWRFAPRVPDFEKPPRAEHEPYLVQLRRESVPVKRKGVVVSHKTSYSGVLSVGIGDQVPQEFRVVFDTGSGHVALPSASCKSESCQIHRRYDMSKSPSAIPINADGTKVPEGELCDQVKIGFGTGSIVGEFARDTVCLGSASAGGAQWRDTMCQEVQIVTAVEMSTTPFKNFGFDGILGLGLQSLALSPDFSFFNLLSKGDKLGAAHFGVFLTDDESGETSEIAIGGYNPARLLQPLSWSPVAKPEQGYWQVEITAVRVNGVELDFCKDGSCRGVMDTGTSHLGIPAPYDKSLAQLLTRDAQDLSDCREVAAPVLEIEVPGFNITLDPENYMRKLPLRAGVNVGSSKGVVLPSQASSTTTLPPTVLRDDGSEVEHYCRPRLMPVNLPAPVGPNLFILGEPVLQRYYTVFDWKGPSIGFGLSTNAQKSKKKKSTLEDGVMFFQVTLTVRRNCAKSPALL
jgi:saccharopepsin